MSDEIKPCDYGGNAHVDSNATDTGGHRDFIETQENHIAELGKMVPDPMLSNTIPVPRELVEFCLRSVANLHHSQTSDEGCARITNRVAQLEALLK